MSARGGGGGKLEQELYPRGQALKQEKYIYNKQIYLD